MDSLLHRWLRSGLAVLTAAFVAGAAAGQVAVDRIDPGAAEPPTDSPTADAPATDTAETGEVDDPEPGGSDMEGSVLDKPCRLEPNQDDVVAETRRMLQETLCGAALWFDGLFGGEPDIGAARDTSGRVELSALYTEFEGYDYDARLRLRYDLPTLERRLNVFLGRGDRDELIQDREERSIIRSSVFLNTEEKWLAGLGYRPAGKWTDQLDFRVGTRVKSAPEVFVQTRLRYALFPREHSVWRFRETLFWENRDGFGTTTAIDYDQILRHDLLFRWANIGTIAEASEGLEWRSSTFLYRSLHDWRAVAGELFTRGATDAEVPLREYGARFIYRQPVGKPYLFGEVVVGYSWPRRELAESRSGSPMIGIGFELIFGRRPL